MFQTKGLRVFVQCLTLCSLAGELSTSSLRAQSTPTTAQDYSAGTVEWAQSNLPELVKLYKHFHTYPELSFQEVETAKRLASEWRQLGFTVTEKVGGHGIVGIMKNGEGPTLMLRCDMDALPITEQTNLVYASQVKVPNKEGVEVGVMHACGHDIHMTNLTGVARFMTDFKDAWRGTLMLIGQPAEERGAGAKAMLKDGLFSRFPKPDYALALHVFADKPAGTVGFRAGYALANVDSVDITMKGAGGHGAYPHATIDPVVQAAELVMALQTIVSREVNPIAPAVVTVGSIHGGTKHNVIGNTCHLQLTVRSYADDVRTAVLDAIKRKAKAVAQGNRAPEPEVKVSEGTPSLENSRDLVEKIVPVFRRVIGNEKVL
ncbi:MAG: amidohydrolase, partial [Planctomycetota bacterium]